jgi:hypothetical protein
MSNRQEFDTPTSVAIHKRATDERGVKRCENPSCRAVIKGRNCHVDHIIADALKSDADKQRKLTAADGQLLCLDCHNEKTRKSDVPAIAKARRREAKDKGVKRPTGKINSVGFDPPAPKIRSDRTGKIDKSALPPLPRRVCGVLIED